MPTLPAHPKEPRTVAGHEHTVRALLTNRKYSVDYYQREYNWERKQVADLVDDLLTKFRAQHQPNHDRSQAQTYDFYFLGSIIVSEPDTAHRFVVDGQQRLTTLTLLLVLLRRRLADTDDRGELEPLIRSRQAGVTSFNLDVPERRTYMEALLAGNEGQLGNAGTESVSNIRSRFEDLASLIPDFEDQPALTCFVDWLLDRVVLVEITAFADDDAYTIFETMNDRGLSLTPTEMLKGYLLVHIKDETQRAGAHDRWKQEIGLLKEFGKDGDAECIKAWLRSQYAKTIRGKKRGARPGDFDRLGTDFHRWVRRHRPRLGLDRRPEREFARFIETDFAFFGRHYRTLRTAGASLEAGLEDVFYNAQNNFSLQYPLMLAPLSVGDDDRTARRKARVVAAWIDIVVHRRVWNYRNFDYSTMEDGMFRVMRRIRRKDVEELLGILQEVLDTEEQTFARNERNAGFGLHGTNRPKVHRLLARMTDWLERRCEDRRSRYSEYSRSGGGGYEIEHIWANKWERHAADFARPEEFAAARDRIGGLVLLPRGANRSYGDLPYSEKRKFYQKENLLARSLCDLAYERSPGFKRFLREEPDLEFCPCEEFGKEELDARQELYRRLAERVWSPRRLEQATRV